LKASLKIKLVGPNWRKGTGYVNGVGVGSYDQFVWEDVCTE